MSFEQKQSMIEHIHNQSAQHITLLDFNITIRIVLVCDSIRNYQAAVSTRLNETILRRKE